MACHFHCGKRFGWEGELFASLERAKQGHAHQQA